MIIIAHRVLQIVTVTSMKKIITLHCITLLHPLNFGMHYHKLATISLMISVEPHIIPHFKADGL